MLPILGDPMEVGALIWGVSITSVLWGWIHSLPRVLGLAGEGGVLQSEVLRAGERWSRGQGPWSWVKPGAGLCSLRSSCSVKASKPLIKSLIRRPGRELAASHSSAGSDAEQLLGRCRRRQR